MLRMEELDDRIRRLTVALDRLAAAWRNRHGLTANEAQVISSLAAGGPTTPKELSELLGLTTAGISTLIDRLEAEQYVSRKRHPSDGRRVLVTLTKRGYVARMDLEEVDMELMSAVPEVDRPAVARFLERAEKIVLDRASRGADTLR